MGCGKEEIVSHTQTITDYLIENQNQFYRYAFSCLHNREEALDAVQTAVCRALEREGTLRNPDAVRTWFYRILVNVCTDALRARSRTVPFPDAEVSYEDPAPEGDLARRVDGLTPEIGTVIKLRFYEELSLKEIAAVTGCNINTVKTRLYTGLRQLRVTLEGELE